MHASSQKSEYLNKIPGIIDHLWNLCGQMGVEHSWLADLGHIKFLTWQEMQVISRQIGLPIVHHDRTSNDKKSQNKIVQATQLSSLEEPRPPRWWTIMLLMSFRLVFLLGKSVRATSWRKTPKLVLTGCFSVSAQTSLKRYSERLLLFELSSSLSRIDDIIVNFREKMRQPTHCTETQRRLFTFTP